MKFSEFTTGLIEKLDSASQNPINHCLLKSVDSSFILTLSPPMLVE